jgi:hypothetical protein
LHIYRSSLISIFAIGWAAGITVKAQASPPNYFNQNLSGAFVYEVKAGPNGGISSPFLNNAAGFGVSYWFRPRRWIALEAGFEQIVRPVGSSGSSRYSTNANDQLYLVPFGVRYVLEPRNSRLRLTAGGGGAYLNHIVGDSYGNVGFFGWGGQFVASGDYAVTRSGRLRLGVTGRYYFASPRPTPDYYAFANDTLHVFTIGPVLSFSFR